MLLLLSICISQAFVPWQIELRAESTGQAHIERDGSGGIGCDDGSCCDHQNSPTASGCCNTVPGDAAPVGATPMEATPGCCDSDCGSGTCGSCCNPVPMQSPMPAESIDITHPSCKLTAAPEEHVLQGSLRTPFLPPRA